ncbi:MAG: alpha-amylase family glycosyl hydrolase [Proteobacteria bacterium]|nr:alpha-amylase family glycosyl hydrolase [Pseudomonadota bacterium]
MSPWRSLVISMSIFLSWQGLSAEYQSSSAQAQTIRQRPITDEIFYFIVIDRFNDGDAANNKAYDKVAVNSPDDKNDIKRHGFQPQLENFYHGGDFAGIRQKLDYLQGLGVSSIWLSPIMKNRATQVSDGPLGVSSGYHGYWILDFTKVDPHWGTEEDFKTLVNEAHNRGIKIFMDVITNHTADLISYRECSDCPYRSRAEYPYSGIKHGKPRLAQRYKSLP